MIKIAAKNNKTFKACRLLCFKEIKMHYNLKRILSMNKNQIQIAIKRLFLIRKTSLIIIINNNRTILSIKPFKINNKT